MGISYNIRCGKLKSKVKVDKVEDLKSVVMRELKQGYYRNIQLGIFVLIKKYRDPFGYYEVYCATDELLVL